MKTSTLEQVADTYVKTWQYGSKPEIVDQLTLSTINPDLLPVEIAAVTALILTHADMSLRDRATLCSELCNIARCC
jgi:hypothetical protein